jgi:hypothetical protein
MMEGGPMSQFKGSGGTLFWGGVEIPIESWSFKGAESLPDGYRAVVSFPTVLTITLHWDARSWWEWAREAEEVIDHLESRRWAALTGRWFRNQPGMRFADLILGAGRN